MTTATEVGTGNYQKIIPTARMVAYFRSFSDIPYARETSVALGAEAATRQIHAENCDLVTRFFGPFAEARYKCFDRFLPGRRNVLELAVGTSVERGICVTQNPGSLYVGTDLPEMIAESKRFLELLDSPPRANHHLEPANALSMEELLAAARPFHGRSQLTIIHEGLWMFLCEREQRVCADNIRKLLASYGGSWITPDFVDRESRQRFIEGLTPEMRDAMPTAAQRIRELTGRDLDDNYFADERSLLSFLNEAGFQMAKYPLVESLDALTSIRRLWGERERQVYEAALRSQAVWVMTLQ